LNSRGLASQAGHIKQMYGDQQDLISNPVDSCWKCSGQACPRQVPNTHDLNGFDMTPIGADFRKQGGETATQPFSHSLLFDQLEPGVQLLTLPLAKHRGAPPLLENALNIAEITSIDEDNRI
jgi:hypothetical protein